ncbi:LOW QUALITY PROTEIN: hypothetical protein ACHAW5_000548 [Stephanodiscus triporus]|uniref:DNA-directed primase/polymerase protein n=1 Tax=Stephanodiscus triporus TaxID=2934178 RepID=A0ABD3P196_9STRA
MEPRLFAMETSVGGRRRYLSGHLGRFVDRYWRECDVESRHYYELIREGSPCRLYFDLEFAKRPNPDLTPAVTERVLDELFDELVREFRIVYNIEVSSDRSSLVDLDSSTSAKFSRHWILHLPGGALFPDARDAGVFVRGFVRRLEEERGSGELRSRGRGLLADYLLVHADEADDIGGGRGGGWGRRLVHFVDTGVYTRNRIFRLLGSTKFGKTPVAALRIADANRYPFPLGFDNSKFYKPAMTSGGGGRRAPPRRDDDGVAVADDDHDFEAFCDSLSWDDHADAMAATLIVPADVSRMGCPILIDPRDHGCSDDGRLRRLRPPSDASRFPRTTAPSYGASPFPKLEGWIVRTLGRRKGLIGSITTWSVGAQRPFPRTVCFNMKDNRFCDNIGRAHKSNNITWNVNLCDRVCWQGCHDPECKGYRGEPIDLPEEVNVEIDDYFFEYELSSLNEDDVVVKRENQQTAHDGDGEFDDAILEAAMRQLDLSSICQSKDGVQASSSSISAICEPCLGPKSGNADVGTRVEYVNANSNTPLSESLLYGDDDEEFDDVLLENALRQLDLSSICKQGCKGSTISEPLSGLKNGNVEVNNPFAKKKRQMRQCK